MINVLMVVPNRADATSLYRSMGPFSELRRHHEFNMVFAPTADWSIVRMVDCVFMQRPSTADHLKLVHMCKQWDIPVWVDFDDLLFDVPTDNPAHEAYMNNATRSQVAGITQGADVVTVSTEQLKRCLQLEKKSLNDRVYVIENGLPDFLTKRKVERLQDWAPLISWRGSNTHAKDCANYAQPIIDYAAKHLNHTFTFIGYNPWFITDAMKDTQAIVAPPMEIGDYLEFMLKTKPYLNLVPLDHSMFNLCKSNIAWIESVLAGAVCLGPDWQEWKKPGMLTYKTPDDFQACMEFALTHPKEMVEFHNMSWAHIREHLLLSKLNEKRWHILNSLYSLSRGRQPDWMPGGERLPDPNDGKILELE